MSGGSYTPQRREEVRDTETVEPPSTRGNHRPHR